MHCSGNSKQILPEMNLRGLVPDFYILVSGRDIYIPTIGLFDISFILKSKKKLTTKINCFYLRSIIFQIGNLYIGHLCELSVIKRD
jgi:hypothetical protein